MVKSDNVQMRSGGGTLLADGTVKWDVRKIGNAEELNGQAIEDFKNELLAAVPKSSKVFLSTGTINRRGTIPLPNGYSRGQCKYCAWLDSLGTNSTSAFYCAINQSNGELVGYIGGSSTLPGSYAVNFGYLCIAVK